MSYMHKYYLHRRVRRAGFLLNTKSKTISLKPSQVPVAQNNKYITELASKYNYGVQLTNPMLDL